MVEAAAALERLCGVFGQRLTAPEGLRLPQTASARMEAVRACDELAALLRALPHQPPEAEAQDRPRAPRSGEELLSLLVILAAVLSLPVPRAWRTLRPPLPNSREREERCVAALCPDEAVPAGMILFAGECTPRDSNQAIEVP